MKNNGKQLSLRVNDNFGKNVEYCEKWTDYYHSTEYEEKCDNCGKIHKVWTQGDNNPDFYTNVYVICDCKNRILFELPVN